MGFRKLDRNESTLRDLPESELLLCHLVIFDFRIHGMFAELTSIAHLNPMMYSILRILQYCPFELIPIDLIRTKILVQQERMKRSLACTRGSMRSKASQCVTHQYQSPIVEDTARTVDIGNGLNEWFLCQVDQFGKLWREDFLGVGLLLFNQFFGRMLVSPQVSFSVGVCHDFFPVRVVLRFRCERVDGYVIPDPID
jgi:hypothetical protein